MRLEGLMKLQELKEVKHALLLPIISCTNRLRWGECEDEDNVEQAVWGLANAITTEADLKDHIVALEQVLEICEAVTKGRYLEDRQRCHGGIHHCEYACTQPDEHCDSFDNR